MQIVGSPPALPGCCFKCRGTFGKARERFVDLEFSFDFHGAVYICEPCVIEMAQSFGMITTDQAVQMAAEIEVLKTDLYEAKKTNDGLERAIDGLTTARRFPSISDVVSDIGDYRPNKTSERSEERISETAGDLESGEDATPEQVHEQGVDDVRPSSSNAGDFKLSGL